MKKLMIAAAIVCAAALSQAASVTWQFTASASGKDQWAGYTVYFFDSATLSEGQTLSTLAISSDLLGDALDSSTLNWYSGTAAGAKNWMYKTGPEPSGTITRQVDDLEGGSVDWTMILVNPDQTTYAVLGTGTTATFDPENEGATSATKTVAGSSITGLTTYTINASTPPTPPDDPTEGVPEPTSGLLMLVGLAGLALRRKQA